MGRNEFWKESIEELFRRLKTGPEGLSEQNAEERLKTVGPNSLKPPRRAKGLILFLSQFKSPLILLLLAAAILSDFLGGYSDANIIYVIVLLSGLLGFFQERGAINSLEQLLKLVENKVAVHRDGAEREISIERLVPGDIVTLRSGDIIPADCILINEKQFFADESTLTGESSPVDKNPGDPLFMGTYVSSGAGQALVVITGKATEYGHITERARFRPPETAFEAGVREFGYLLMVVTMILVVLIFIVNIFLNHPIMESFLFALALAVGLTPQLLPAIISVNLSHGARRMAKKRVVVKRLASIENFGQMNVLCSDKTGTVTVGKIALDRTIDADFKASEKVALYAFLNAHFQTTYSNPLDKAIWEKLKFDCSNWQMTGEIPYDFHRKTMGVIFGDLLISKGAVSEILARCDRVEWADGAVTLIDEHRQRFEEYFEQQSAAGFRSLAVAYTHGQKEENLILLGFLHFFDPLKPDIAIMVNQLKTRGIHLKIITGDHHSVAAFAAQAMGMHPIHYVTGRQIQNASDEELKKIVQGKNIFAEVAPNQKERIILALRAAGHVVGYLGDGINDINALHSADVSIAVESGADAAKETADIVLLEKDLAVLNDGIEEGRLTFANTLKYIYMATSANFGNMFSMACASVFLPFLPLLPKQVLLVNLLTDVPEMAIATDRVDPDFIEKPVKWNLHLIRKFMVVFGLISSLFDFITFGVLIYFLKAGETLFQTGWFVESVVSATLIVFAIRTRRSIFASRPSYLLAGAIALIVLTVIFLPEWQVFGFVPLPRVFYLTLAGIVILYISIVEYAKKIFYRKANGYRPHPS